MRGTVTSGIGSKPGISHAKYSISAANEDGFDHSDKRRQRKKLIACAWELPGGLRRHRVRMTSRFAKRTLQGAAFLEAEMEHELL